MGRISIVLLWVMATPIHPAWAYTYESPVGDGCHEKITKAALRQVRELFPVHAPTSGAQRALIDDLPFTVPNDMEDLAAAALLIAVRDNDIKGHESIDIRQLALIHGDPETQQEHCLRRTSDDGPSGNETALAACRAFIQYTAHEAIAGLDNDGEVNLEVRTKLPVFLAIRGRVEPALPRTYVRLGQAAHALQDSFTHLFRASDGMGVTAVSNWIDWLEDDYDERRDGPPHIAAMDVCDNPDELRRLRRELATRATVELFEAVLRPEFTPRERSIALDDLLTQYLQLDDSCTFANNWCNAPELQLAAERGCACRSTPSSLVLVAVVWGFVGWRRWVRHRSPRQGD